MGYKKTRKNHRKSVRRKSVRRIIIVILGFAHLDSEACTLRLQTGVNEFFRHPSAWLLTTGGYTGRNGSEGDDLASRALALGVPKNRILVEDQAKNTIENAQLTYRLLARRFPAKIMVCTNEFHMDRSLHIFRKMAPKNCTVVPLPAPNGDPSLLFSQTGLSLSEWMAHEKEHMQTGLE
jgi:uncharacterized SAM-binding protein YcdF (DUF218 family)